jgi:phospholipid transport system substrate-binding protein
MTDRRRFLCLALAGSSLALIGARPAVASIEQEAASFLTDLGNKAIAQLTDKSVSGQERVDRFRALLMEGVSFPLIAQQVLGPRWRDSSEALREEFSVVLRESLISRFIDVFEDYQGETFDVASTRTSSKDASLVAATTQVVAPNGETAKLEWFIKRFDQGFRIYDVTVEGVRLSASLKDEYDAVLVDNDGDVADLIQQMKARLPSTAKL